jgi:hypothetical protein
MPLSIAILEDNLDRRCAMQRWLDDRLYMYQHLFFDEAAEMVAWLEQYRGECLIIGLDHDLELKQTPDGRWADPGTGRMVADYLAAQLPPLCPVLVHSSNGPAADGMVALLQETGWQVDAVRPYADTKWIDETWWPAFRRMLLEAETRIASKA